MTHEEDFEKEYASITSAEEADDIASSYFEREHYQLAEKAALKAIQLDEKYTSGWETLAEIYEKQGKPEQAVITLKKVLDIDPHLQGGWYNLYDMLQKAGEIEESFKALEKSIKSDPDDKLALTKMAYRLYELKQIGEAIDHLAAACYLDSEYEDAKQLVDRLIKKQKTKSPSSSEDWYRFAQLYRVQKNMDKAIHHCKKALEVDSNNKQAKSLLGLLLTDNGSYPDALEVYDELLSQEIESANPYVHAGIIMAVVDKLDEAVEILSIAVEIESTSFNAWREYARLLCMKHELDKAQSACENALAIRPNDWYAGMMSSYIEKMKKVQEEERTDINIEVEIYTAVGPKTLNGFVKPGTNMRELIYGFEDLNIATLNEFFSSKKPFKLKISQGFREVPLDHMIFDDVSLTIM